MVTTLLVGVCHRTRMELTILLIPSLVTSIQSANRPKKIGEEGRLLVTNQMNTPMNHTKNRVESRGPNVPMKGSHWLGAATNGIMMNTAIATPISASPAINPADINVPLLISSLPAFIAACVGSPNSVPSILK